MDGPGGHADAGPGGDEMGFEFIACFWDDAPEVGGDGGGESET